MIFYLIFTLSKYIYHSFLGMGESIDKYSCLFKDNSRNQRKVYGSISFTGVFILIYWCLWCNILKSMNENTAPPLRIFLLDFHIGPDELNSPSRFVSCLWKCPFLFPIFQLLISNSLLLKRTILLNEICQTQMKILIISYYWRCVRIYRSWIIF